MVSYQRSSALYFRRWRFSVPGPTIRPDHQPMACGTWGNIEPEAHCRSFGSRKRMVADRNDRYALSADGDRSLRHADDGVGFSTAELVDRAKHDGRVCRNRN